MEVNIPFSLEKITVDDDKETILYKAILSRDGLFFGLFDHDKTPFHDAFIAIDDIVTSNSPDRTYPFESVLICLNNPLFGFDEISAEDNLAFEEAIVFQLGIKHRKKYSFLSKKLPKLGIELGYVMPNAIIREIDKVFGNVSFMHYQEVLLGNLEMVRRYPNLLKISQIANNLNVALFFDGKFQFSNCYRSYTESDFYYFVALIFDQFQLHSRPMMLSINGFVSDVKFDRQKFSRLFGHNFVNDVWESTTLRKEPLLNLASCA